MEIIMAQKPVEQPVNTEVSPEKLAAWARCREIWKASGKPPRVTDALLEAEQEAKDTP
jgi:hypothetical protein